MRNKSGWKMTNCYKKISLVCLCFLCSVFGKTQTSLDSNIDSYIKDLSAVWSKYDTISFNSFFSVDTLAKPTFTVSFFNPASKLKSLQLQINRQEQLIKKKDLGFSLNGLYQYNFQRPFADPNEIIVFRQKATFGIDWDFLNNGLYENRILFGQLKNKYKAINAKRLEENVAKFQQKNTENIINFFNKHKLSVLQKRRELVNDQKPTVEKLYALKQLTTDSYIKLFQHETDIYGQLNLYRGYNDAARLISSDSNSIKETPPLVDIDVQKLFQISNITTPDSSVYYEKESLKQGSYFLRDLTLRASLKYNYYDLYNNTTLDRNFVSVGMNFSMPLAFNYSNKKELNRLNGELIQTKNTAPNQDLNYILINTFYEYRYKLKQYFNFIEKRKAFGELIRTEQVKKQMGDIEFNPNTALYILDDYWSITIELLDIKQDLYKLLLAINAKLPNHVLNDFIKPVEIAQYAQPVEKPYRAIYIWSDAFKNHDVQVLTNYCELNEFSHLLLSYNTTKSHLQNVNQFISKNYTKNIALMVGSNKLFTNGNISSYLDSLKQNINLTFIKEIHLDIEPHTMDGFKENKDAFFAKYIKLLKLAQQFTGKNKLNLSVSIPLNYPESVLTEIFKLCSNVYLMAYENVKPEFINEKIKEEIALGKDKIVIALRTKDFENRSAMDQHFKLFQIKKIAYHDIDDLLNFDNKSINVKDK